MPEAEYLIRKHKNDDKISVYLKIHSCLQGRQPPDPRAEITYRTCQFYYLQYLHLENKNKLNPYYILFFILLNLLHFAYKSGHKLLNFHHLFLAHQLFNIGWKMIVLELRVLKLYVCVLYFLFCFVIFLLCISMYIMQMITLTYILLFFSHTTTEPMQIEIKDYLGLWISHCLCNLSCKYSL